MDTHHEFILAEISNKFKKFNSKTVKQKIY